MEAAELKVLISKEIEKRRLYLGATRAEMGVKIGATRNWWTMMEGTCPPTNLGTLLRVCEALECSLADFFNSIYGVGKFPEENAETTIRSVVVKAFRRAGIAAEVNFIIKK